VAFAESVAAARSYATKFNYKIDADRELIALADANTGAGISQGFCVGGSLSKNSGLGPGRRQITVGRYPFHAYNTLDDVLEHSTSPDPLAS
jgi:hypothetical protein